MQRSSLNRWTVLYIFLTLVPCAITHPCVYSVCIKAYKHNVGWDPLRILQWVKFDYSLACMAPVFNCIVGSFLRLLTSALFTLPCDSWGLLHKSWVYAQSLHTGRLFTLRMPSVGLGCSRNNHTQYTIITGLYDCSTQPPPHPTLISRLSCVERP